MTYLNLAIVEGNITKDAKAKHVADGAAVTSFTLACDAKPGEKREGKTDFIHVEIWGENFADKVCPHLKKGVAVRVRGRIRSDSWNAENGERKERTYIRCDSLDFLKTSAKEGSSPSFIKEEMTDMTEVIECGAHQV